MDKRKRRIAENELRFRAINERLAADLERHDVTDGVITFVCECGHSDCTQPLELTSDEYARGREDQMIFLVVPGHEIPDAETVLAKTERYAVVRKHAETQPLIDEKTPSDQRS